MRGFEKPSIKTEIPGPESRMLSQRLKAVECQNVTYLAEDYPIFLNKSDATNVWDVDGNRYVDLTSFFGVSFIGHNHPLIRRCLGEPDLVNGLGDVLPSVSKVELLEEINRLLGGGYVGILGQNGSDAVESAIKTAYLYTGKPGIIAFKGAYHGLSLGALMATYNPKFKDPFRAYLPDNTIYFVFPTSLEESDAVGREIEDHLRSRNDVGLVILELIQARGGVKIVPKDFVKRLAELSKEYGVVLAFDEIYTGCGRCGRLFLYEYYGVQPDVIILGKALSSSFPLSVMMAKEHIMKAWPKSGGEAIHTSTFLGHPLMSKVALEVLRYIEKEKLWKVAEKSGEYLMKKLLNLREKHPDCVKDVRGMGLLVGIELNGISAFELSKELLKMGYIVLPSGLNGEVLEITPPVIVSKEIIDDFIQVLSRVLEQWTSIQK